MNKTTNYLNYNTSASLNKEQLKEWNRIKKLEMLVVRMKLKDFIKNNNINKK